ARALGEVAREVQMDPRIVERESGAAGDLLLANQEERQRERRGGENGEVSACAAQGLRASPACTPRTRSGDGRPAACRGNGRTAARSPSSPGGAPMWGSSDRRTTRAASS